MLETEKATDFEDEVILSSMSEDLALWQSGPQVLAVFQTVNVLKNCQPKSTALDDEG
jgi:hypothetical protein